jgi:hypothetical protein
VPTRVRTSEATLGCRHHSWVRHGIALGGYGSLELCPAWDVFVTGGIVVYPNGNEHLRAAENIAPDVDIAFPGATLEYTFNVGLAFFP